MKHTCLALLITSSAFAASAQTYDTVLLNGRVVDPETGFDQIANVGIKDGWIDRITDDPIEGAETVDVTGLVVGPGFIDSHTHGSQQFAIRMSMMDGVTSGFDSEAGVHGVADWYAREEGKWPINYAACVGHEYARFVVMDGLDVASPSDALDLPNYRGASLERDGVPDWSVTPPNIEQMNEIVRIIDKGLQEGAICIGSLLGYAANGISTYEQYKVQEAGAKYGRPTASHTRFHGSSVNPEGALGFDEVFTNAVLTGAPLLYSHNNEYGWWEIEEKLQLARAMGLNMWSEYYPYTRGSTTIGADGLKPDFLADVLGYTYEDIQLFDTVAGELLDRDGYDRVVAEDPGRLVIFENPARRAWIPELPRVPHMVVASDSMYQTGGMAFDADPLAFSGHPRTAGSHATVLMMARDMDIPLTFALSQLSYWSAYHWGKAGVKFFDLRGRMQEGMVADITIFDAAERGGLFSLMFRAIG